MVRKDKGGGMENIIEDVIMVFGALLVGIGIDIELWSIGLFGSMVIIIVGVRKIYKLVRMWVYE